MMTVFVNVSYYLRLDLKQSSHLKSTLVVSEKKTKRKLFVVTSNALSFYYSSVH